MMRNGVLYNNQWNVRFNEEDMPSPATTHLPRPRSWDEFEDMCADVLKRIWKDTYVVRNGRTGQRQDGVDIYGYPERLGGHFKGKVAGAQCKETDVLTIAIVEAEVEKAKAFEPRLTEYLVLTTAKRDAALQKAVRTKQWEFRVHVLFWEDISLELSSHDDLLQKYFPNWLRKTTSRDDVLRLMYSAGPDDFDYDDETGVYVYIKDINLRLIADRSSWFDADRSDTDRFEEDWVKKFPHGRAYRQIIYVEYGRTRLATIYCALVDGGRYLIPYPKSPDHLVISREQYTLGNILNRGKKGVDSFDFGLYLAGIVVEE